MTVRIRVIPCLDVAEGRVVKGVNFVDLKDAGDPVEQARAYSDAGADELCFLDISATHEGRGTLLDVVRRTARVCFMPLTVGGGVASVEDARALLLAGADKGRGQQRGRAPTRTRRGDRGPVRQSMHRGIGRCAAGVGGWRAGPMGNIHPWRAARHRDRRDRTCGCAWPDAAQASCWSPRWMATARRRGTIWP